MTFRRQIGWAYLIGALALAAAILLKQTDKAGWFSGPQGQEAVAFYVGFFIIVAWFGLFLFGLWRQVARALWHAHLRHQRSADQLLWNNPIASMWRWLLNIDREGNDRDAAQTAEPTTQI